MSKQLARACFGSAIALAGEGTAKHAPTRIQVFPKGPKIKARDGREWTANPEAVLAAFQESSVNLALDFEHAIDLAKEKGEDTKGIPASGWLTGFHILNGGEVWADVEWTARAEAMIVAKEYRYFSPAFSYDGAGVITSVIGGGLVQRPALEMTALSRIQDNPSKETTMSLKAIAAALGLADTADETAVLAKINANAASYKAVCAALGTDAAGDHKVALAAIDTLKKSKDTETGKDAEIAALKTTIAENGKALAALQEKDTDRDIDAALDAAAAEGKITPATREPYRAMCKTTGGLDKFKALAKTLPVICEPSKLGEKTPDTTQDTNVDPVALAAKASKYRNEQHAVGNMISTADAVAFVKEQK